LGKRRKRGVGNQEIFSWVIRNTCGYPFCGKQTKQLEGQGPPQQKVADVSLNTRKKSPPPQRHTNPPFFEPLAPGFFQFVRPPGVGFLLRIRSQKGGVRPSDQLEPKHSVTKNQKKQFVHQHSLPFWKHHAQNKGAHRSRSVGPVMGGSLAEKANHRLN